MVRVFRISNGLLTALCYRLIKAQYIPGLQSAEPEDVGMSSYGMQQTKQQVQDYINQGRVPGVMYAVTRYGKLVAQEAIGNKGANPPIAMTADTIFRIQSQGKPLGVAGFLTLVDEGLVGLDDFVSMYIPEFSNLQARDGWGTQPARPMTIRHLLTQTAGMTYGFMDTSQCDIQYQMNDILNLGEDMRTKVQRVARIPLCNQPGARWQYGINIDVLGYIASVVTGLPIDEFYKQRLFLPLGMVDTDFWVPPDKAHRLSPINLSVGGILRTVGGEQDYTRKPAYLATGGGLVTTIADFLRFGQMLLNLGELNGVRILQPNTVKQMLTNQLPPQLLPYAYNRFIAFSGRGYGWGIGVANTAQHNADNYGHARSDESSWGGGLSTNFYISPADGTVIVAFMQIEPYTEEVHRLLRSGIYSAIDAGAQNAAHYQDQQAGGQSAAGQSTSFDSPNQGSPISDVQPVGAQGTPQQPEHSQEQQEADISAHEEHESASQSFLRRRFPIIAILRENGGAMPMVAPDKQLSASDTTAASFLPRQDIPKPQNSQTELSELASGEFHSPPGQMPHEGVGAAFPTSSPTEMRVHPKPEDPSDTPQFGVGEITSKSMKDGKCV